MLLFSSRTAELQDQLAVVSERIRQADSDLEETKGEKSQKYKDLKKRESDISGNCSAFMHHNVKSVANVHLLFSPPTQCAEFLNTFEENKKLEQVWIHSHMPMRW